MNLEGKALLTSIRKHLFFVRCLAKTVDLCLLFLLSSLLPHPVGVLFGLIYVLIHDGIPRGKSLGKRIFHLQVVDDESWESPCTLRQSAIRNAPFGVATFFGVIPLWGWLIAIILGLPLILIEIYLMATQEKGLRLGDVMADTKVIVTRPSEKN